ncbi:MAG: hypothetical protein WC666_02615 [Candidatus Paceibacterota bacterium]|jgi:hypothetical protein
MQNAKCKTKSVSFFLRSFFVYQLQREWSKLRRLRNKGDIIVSVLVFAAIAVVVIIGLVNWGATMLRSIRTVVAREQAFQIAEAGADYYQWHLAQAPNDYTDSTGGPGPYVHEFYDKDGNLLGNYSLTITPPIVGSTLVKVVSVGTLASSTVTRTIEKTMAIPSLAKYAVVVNDNIRFGEGTEVFGPIQANGGIRFDGVAHNLISSAKATYIDPDNNSSQFGVYTTSGTDDPHPPSAVPNRPDVFMAGRQFPVPAADFVGLTAGLTKLQELAQPAVGGKEWLASGAEGYHIVFKVTNGVTSYDMYKVITLQTPPGNGKNKCGSDNTAESQTQWGTWSIKSPISSNQTSLGNFSIPSNGVIFVNDDVWVDGTIKNARVTVVAGIIGNTDPAKNSNITINDNLIYSDYDGTSSIGLIAQGNINAGMMSANNLRIDGALVAEKGRVGRFYYSDECTIGSTNYSLRNSITLNGMIATYIRYGFAYTDNTGYDIRNIYYDANFLYGPPPSFPQATNQYQVISWREL